MKKFKTFKDGNVEIHKNVSVRKYTYTIEPTGQQMQHQHYIWFSFSLALVRQQQTACKIAVIIVKQSDLVGCQLLSFFIFSFRFRSPCFWLHPQKCWQLCFSQTTLVDTASGFYV